MLSWRRESASSHRAGASVGGKPYKVGACRWLGARPQTRPARCESREWVSCLAGAGRDARSAAERERALARRRQLLLRAAHAELRRRSHPVRIEGRERDDLAHQAADDALLAITGKLDGFRGDSRFTTWAPLADAELRRAVPP